MKNIFFSLALCVCVFSPQGQAKLSSEVEVKLNHVLAPIHGFDDNDMIQVVVDGNLPNACHHQALTQVHVDPSTKHILIKQFAKLSQDGACADTAHLPPELKAPVPFSHEVNVGQLLKGEYKIIYETHEGFKERSLIVEQAPAATIDSMRYASVINAFVNDFIMASEPTIEIRLTLQINSSCSGISDESKILFQEGVVIILPEIIKDENSLCFPVSRAAYKVFKAPNPGVGRFLLHVRSLGGAAKNKLFTVLVPQ